MLRVFMKLQNMQNKKKSAKYHNFGEKLDSQFKLNATNTLIFMLSS